MGTMTDTTFTTICPYLVLADPAAEMPEIKVSPIYLGGCGNCPGPDDCEAPTCYQK